MGALHFFVNLLIFYFCFAYGNCLVYQFKLRKAKKKLVRISSERAFCLPIFYYLFAYNKVIRCFKKRRGDSHIYSNPLSAGPLGCSS